MKKNAFFVVLVACSMRLLSAEVQIDSVVDYKSPLYIQLYGGINKSANENLPWIEFSSYPWAGGAFVGVGKEFNSFWGWRVALRYNHNKSRNVPVCESSQVWGWKNIGLFGDITFDISDVFRPSSKRNQGAFDLKAFAGVGLARTWGFDTIVPLSYTHPYSKKSRILPAARAGLTATWRVADNWLIGTELSHTLFEDHFNGVSADFPLDARTNLKVGVTYLLIEKERDPLNVERRNRLKECPPLPLIMPEEEEVKERRVSGRAFLDFPVNETVIYPTYRKNDSELRRIQATVDSALFDQSIIITRISLHGYASPESPYSNNTRLAMGRTEALKNYLMQKYGFNSALFNNAYTPEDWVNLRGFLENMQGRRVKGDFWYDNKEYVETPEAPAYVHEYCSELLDVIDRDMDLDEKEILLKQVGRGAPYAWLYKYVYPGLRHTDYIIEYEVKPYSAKDGRKLIYTHPEALSAKEMYLVANCYPEGSDAWVDALLIAVKYFPDDETSNFNAACACIKTRRLTDARKYLAKAGNNSHVTFLHNVILAMEGLVKWRMVNGQLIIIEDE